MYRSRAPRVELLVAKHGEPAAVAHCNETARPRKPDGDGQAAQIMQAAFSQQTVANEEPAN